MTPDPWAYLSDDTAPPHPASRTRDVVKDTTSPTGRGQREVAASEAVIAHLAYVDGARLLAMADHGREVYRRINSPCWVCKKRPVAYFRLDLCRACYQRRQRFNARVRGLMAAKPTCGNPGPVACIAPVFTRDRCQACDRWRRRNGGERPAERVAQTNARREAAAIASEAAAHLHHRLKGVPVTRPPTPEEQARIIALEAEVARLEAEIANIDTPEEQA